MIGLTSTLYILTLWLKTVNVALIIEHQLLLRNCINDNIENGQCSSFS